MRRITALFLVLILIIVAFTSCADKSPTASETLEMAEQSLRIGDYELAVMFFLNATKIDAQKVRGYTGAADAYIALKNIPSAVAILQKGMEVLPANEEIVKKQTEVVAVATANKDAPASEAPVTSEEVTSAQETSKPTGEIVKPENYLAQEIIRRGTVVAKGGVRLRTGPDSGYDMITVMPHDAQVIEVGYDDIQSGWIYINYKDYHGWASTEYIKFAEE